MNAIILKTVVIGLLPLSSCLFSASDVKAEKSVLEKVDVSITHKEPHRYGGWYCPDNLNTFPAVDLEDWNKVPAIEGRLPTEEEAKAGKSLILVDTEKYPDAKALNTSLPQLAKYHNPYTNREDLIIIIQAISVAGDSIVGFRNINGGNGSARINEVKFINLEQAQQIAQGKFVHHEVNIKAMDTVVWKLITAPENAALLQVTFDPQNKLPQDWRTKAKYNYNYPQAKTLVNSYISDDFWGNCYVQNDYSNNLYTEKIFLVYDKEKRQSVLKIVCGPFKEDYASQEKILKNWATRIKDLSQFNTAIPNK